MNFCALRSPSFKVIWIIQLKNSFLLENLRHQFYENKDLKLNESHLLLGVIWYYN